MVTIEVNNNKCTIRGPLKILNRIYKDEKFSVKHPNAFHLIRGGYVQKGWDGRIHYITENFNFKTGLLPMVNTWFEDAGVKVKLVDNRPDFKIKPKLTKWVGEHNPFEHQMDAINSIINNRVGNILFWNCVVDAATNAGKTTIMAGVYLAFQRKIPALVLVKDGDLFQQMVKEFPKLVGDDIGIIRGKKITFGNFTIAMVQTLSPKVSQYKAQLARIGMLLVDEADEGESKSYKRILNACYNANIKIGLSGSIYMSELKRIILRI